jgi:hypothetical protein
MSMKSTFARFVCRILAASIIVLPFHAQAGLIGTDQSAPVDRSGVTAQLQAYGLSPQEAKERVAALTDAEVAALADRIDALPAGGIVGLLPIIVVVLLVWHFTNPERADAKSAPKPAPKPAAKPAPAPEKK